MQFLGIDRILSHSFQIEHWDNAHNDRGHCNKVHSDLNLYNEIQQKFLSKKICPWKSKNIKNLKAGQL
jgi:hypothetical protein